MTVETLQILKSRMKGKSPWIFPSRRKPGSHIGRINSAHDRIVAEATKEGVIIDYVPYDFRHTFATRVAQNNTDLPTLASLLGHDGIRCVLKYVHPTAEHKKMAMKSYDRKMRRESRKAPRRTKR
jgi:integrase